MTYQVKVVKDFRGFVHLSHGDQDLIVNVLLVGPHVKPYSGLQRGVHLQQQRTNCGIQADFITSTSFLSALISHHFRREAVQVFSSHNVSQVLLDQPLFGVPVCRTAHKTSSNFNQNSFHLQQ